ncbi:FAD-binding protein [Delftia tsuruhatensis]
MTAALVGALEGYKVTLFEASEQVGGTTATSAGTLWIPGNSQGLRAGHEDSVEKARTYLDALIGQDDPRGLRAAYLSSAAHAIDYLQARSAVEFLSSGTHRTTWNSTVPPWPVERFLLRSSMGAC